MINETNKKQIEKIMKTEEQIAEEVYILSKIKVDIKEMNELLFDVEDFIENGMEVITEKMNKSLNKLFIKCYKEGYDSGYKKCLYNKLKKENKINGK